MSPPFYPKRAPGFRIPCSSSKRRRLAPPGARPWASLPEDLVQLIGWRVLAGDLLDYVRFRAVCIHWSSSSVRPRGRGLLDPRFHPRRWMMLPEGHGLCPGHPNLGGYVRFFNLSTGVFVRVHLPLFDDHIVLDSTDGLLLLYRHPDTAIRLLHPFTGEIAELPPLLSLLPQIEPHARSCMTEDMELSIFLRGICAAVNVSATGAITVMLALDMIKIHRVAYATAGDQQWSISAWKLPPLRTQAVSFQGKLYVMSQQSASYQHNNKVYIYQPASHQDNDEVYIYQIDRPQPNAQGSHSLSLPLPVMIAECPLVETISIVHLVECGSDLMLVGFNHTSDAHLVVYKLNDLISGRVVPVKNIGEHALFVEERGVCVSPNKVLPSVLGNSITCINRAPTHNPQVETRDPRQSCPRVEQYHLSSGTWSLAMDGDILCMDRAPASPYMLAHHIFTCCSRGYWNKGLISCAAIRPNWSVKPNLRIKD
ncbi:uncharacterized protein LOC133914477 [Phragmites australis]|uniref:uncharacterized protein LOC133914477 n=1 Tax=Phragmites australis TaxID=29695 RepID=UPI002D797BE6|nr:uncharacterized protein LOC133914477 [Phragmites australis]